MEIHKPKYNDKSKEYEVVITQFNKDTVYSFLTLSDANNFYEANSVQYEEGRGG